MYFSGNYVFVIYGYVSYIRLRYELEYNSYNNIVRGDGQLEILISATFILLVAAPAT